MPSLFSRWFGSDQPGQFVMMGAMEQIASARDLDELQRVLESRPEIMVTRHMLDTLKGVRQNVIRAGKPEVAKELDIPIRVIDHALRIGVAQAVAQEQQQREQMLRVAITVLNTAPWDMEDVVQEHLSVIVLPGFQEILRNFYEYQCQQEPMGEIATAVAQMKMQYAQEAVSRGVAYAEQEFKGRYQRLAIDHHWQLAV